MLTILLPFIEPSEVIEFITFCMLLLTSLPGSYFFFSVKEPTCICGSSG